ncbi:MAG: hypothetical protein K0R92_2800 [Lachnospiraceae bacterium]|nr:hypothetical protein [Lachnospiraceae bacterium]
MKLKLCKILLVINIVFWLIISIGYSIYNADSVSTLYSLIKVLLFLEPVLFLILLIGTIKKNRLIYLSGLILTFFNVVGSVMDELGVIDVFSMMLSLCTFIILLACKSNWRNTTK